MSKNYKKLYAPLLIIITFLVLFSVSIFLGYKTEKAKPAKALLLQVLPQVVISAGETTVHLSVAPNTLFYDALAQAKDAGKILFSGKNYPGLGFFVTDIGTLHSGNGKNLLYYINGKEAAVGVSSYTLKDGDIIEWKLK